MNQEKSSSDWGAADKRAYQAALKKYNDFISKGSNNLTKEEYDKKAKELKEKMELAKRNMIHANLVRTKTARKHKKAAAKAEVARAKEEAAEERRKQTKEKVGQELAELQRKNDEEEINTMQEGLEKKSRQIENDYQALLQSSLPSPINYLVTVTRISHHCCHRNANAIFIAPLCTALKTRST